jgi:hypothetical protein
VTFLDRIAFAFTGLVLLGLVAVVVWGVLSLWPLALTGH